jgi:hypothetical protein
MAIQAATALVKTWAAFVVDGTFICGALGGGTAFVTYVSTQDFSLCTPAPASMSTIVWNSRSRGSASMRVQFCRG